MCHINRIEQLTDWYLNLSKRLKTNNKIELNPQDLFYYCPNIIFEQFMQVFQLFLISANKWPNKLLFETYFREV